MNVALTLIPIIFLISVYGAIFLVGIGIFCLRGLGLYTMAKNTGMKNPWFAWVPILHEYLVGAMADRYLTWRGKPTGYAMWNVILACSTPALMGTILANLFPLIILTGSASSAWFISAFVLFWIVYAFLFLVIIAYRIIHIVSLYHLYNDFDPNNVLAYTLMSVFGLDFISLIMIRDNIPVAIAGSFPQGQPKYHTKPPQRPYTQP